MTNEQIKQRFDYLQKLQTDKGAPWEFSKRTARQTLIKELVSLGFTNADAVYKIYKARQCQTK